MNRCTKESVVNHLVGFDMYKKHFSGPEIVQKIVDKVKIIREIMLSAQSFQKSYVDLKR